MKSIFLFVFLVVHYPSLGHAQNVVMTTGGALKGIQLTSRQNRTYFGFLAIPYGKVPQRFSVPEPSESWSGVKDATILPPHCFQFNAIVKETSGVEDCLFLNVYSPKLKTGENLPVMFWIFPGGFQFGGASSYDPKYFMDQNVVIVTINYRLGALGFLNTGDGTVTGNMGLKDQLLALKWVQTNIRNFGGNPNLVTIFGLSAGAASVDYLTLSPLAKGIFHRAIALSGSTLNPWAYQSQPLELANKFTEYSGCARPNWAWPQKVKCLQELDPHAIVDAQLKLMTLGIDLDFLHMKFVPSIESEMVTTPRFLDDSPYNLLSSGRIESKVPYMTGFTENEGHFFTAKIFQDENLVKSYDEHWSNIAPFTLYYDNLIPHGDQIQVSESIRKFYMGEKRISVDTQREFTNIFSDRLFTNGIGKGVTLRSHYQPVYAYILSYQGEYSLPMGLFGTKHPEGTSHADDVIYLWNEGFGAPQMRLGTRDGEFSESLLKVLVSFAIDGKPIPWGQQKEWPAQSSAGDGPIYFVKLDEYTELFEDPGTQKRTFWESLKIGEHEGDDKFSQKVEL